MRGVFTLVAGLALGLSCMARAGLVRWVRAGAVDPVGSALAFYAEAASTPAGELIAVDVLVTAAIAFLFVLTDGERIGAVMRLYFAVVTLMAPGFGLALFLVYAHRPKHINVGMTKKEE